MKIMPPTNLPMNQLPAATIPVCLTDVQKWLAGNRIHSSVFVPVACDARADYIVAVILAQ